MTPENHEQRITDLELKVGALVADVKSQAQLNIELIVAILDSNQSQREMFIQLFKIMGSQMTGDIRPALMSFLAKAETADEQSQYVLEKVKKSLRPPPES
jgi:hypothetical protein